MKNKKRINTSDAVIILAFLAIACGLFLRKPIEKMTEELFYSTDITYHAELTVSDSQTIKAGDEIFSADAISLGTVTKTFYSAANDGLQRHLTIVVDAKAIKNEKGIFVASKAFVAPGSQLEIVLKDGNHFYCIVQKVETR